MESGVDTSGPNTSNSRRIEVGHGNLEICGQSEKVFHTKQPNQMKRRTNDGVSNAKGASEGDDNLLPIVITSDKALRTRLVNLKYKQQEG